MVYNCWVLLKSFEFIIFSVYFMSVDEGILVYVEHGLVNRSVHIREIWYSDAGSGIVFLLCLTKSLHNMC